MKFNIFSLEYTHTNKINRFRNVLLAFQNLIIHQFFILCPLQCNQKTDFPAFHVLAKFVSIWNVRIFPFRIAVSCSPFPTTLIIGAIAFPKSYKQQKSPAAIYVTTMPPCLLLQQLNSCRTVSRQRDFIHPRKEMGTGEGALSLRTETRLHIRTCWLCGEGGCLYNGASSAKINNTACLSLNLLLRCFADVHVTYSFGAEDLEGATILVSLL